MEALPPPEEEFFEMEAAKAFHYTWSDWLEESPIIRAKLVAHELAKGDNILGLSDLLRQLNLSLEAFRSHIARVKGPEKGLVTSSPTGSPDGAAVLRNFARDHGILVVGIDGA